MPKTLVLIDGHSLAYRMYFALERTGMATSQKEPTWAIYGFFNALFSLLKEVKPDAMALSFDVGRVTFRNEIYTEYKAHREAMPDALRAQMGAIRQAVELLGIPIYEKENYEADDVIGTLTQETLTRHPDWQVWILTGDQDSFQLVDDTARRVQVLLPGRSPQEGLRHFDREAVYAKWGVYPEQVTDFKGLKGDPSDNIPGVPGVGDKTAAKLLGEHGSLEKIYAALETMPANKLREKLATYQDQAFLSKKLAVIDRAVPLDRPFQLEDCHLVIPDPEALMDFLRHYEFRSFLQQAPTLLAPFVNGNGGNGLALKEAEVPSLVELSFTPLVEEALLETPPEPEAASVLSVLTADLFQPAHEVVTTSEQLAAWVEKVRHAGAFALDLETTGLDIFAVELVGVALAVSPGFQTVARPPANVLHLKDYPPAFSTLTFSGTVSENIKCVYIPVGHENGEPQLGAEEVLAALKPLLADAALVKIVHNAKYELNCFRRWEAPVAGLVFDTMIASYVEKPDRRHGLKTLGFECLGHTMQEISGLIGTGKKQIPFSQVPLEKAAPYAACDAYVTLELAQRACAGMTDDQKTLFYEVEMPLAHCIAAMEYEGVAIDREHLAKLNTVLEEKLAVVEKTIYELAGVTFNINSPKQVGEVLFEKLGLQPLRKTAKKTAYSTDAKVLESLAGEHPVVDQILEHRKIFKLKTTYVEALPQLVNPATGRIHTSFNQTVTATGRLSSSEPNLQNIPIRTELGRSIREAFIPEKKGWVLLSADYSQIELRLLAHFSKEPTLLKAFQEGQDIHAATAALMFGLPIEAIKKEQRYQAKAVNFGIIYGQTAHGLSQQLKIPRAEAQLFIDRYFQKYPQVRGFIESVKKQAHETGRVTTIAGRARDLREGLNSSVKSIREFSERAAFNTPLQGSAADLMKIAMIRLYDKLKRERAQSRFILQVHDELVLEVPESELEQASTWIRWAMELDQPLAVPLVVDLHSGASWLEA